MEYTVGNACFEVHCISLILNGISSQKLNLRYNVFISHNYFQMPIMGLAWFTPVTYMYTVTI